MCLIIRCEKDKPISKALMKHWCKKNGDGWGMMWIKDNTLQTFKSMENDDVLYAKYEELKEFDPLIHLRWRTHGDTDLANCHPYYCGHGIFLMHNGVLHDAETYNKTKSDTWHFIEEWIKNIFALVENPHKTMRTEQFRKIVEKAIGSNNRIVLGDRGGFVYFNLPAWHTIDNKETGVTGLLVSNTYTWDATSYGKPKVHYSYSHHSKGWDDYDNIYPTKPPTYHTHNYNAKPIPHIDGKFRNSLGEVVIHTIGNIYTDINHLVWLWQNGVFQRYPELDKNIRRRIRKEEKKNKKQQSLILLPPPALATMASNDKEAEAVVQLNQQEYNDILVKQWKNESPAAIHSLVYAEPEDAAKVLCSLMGK